jgi:hypothetical protein
MLIFPLRFNEFIKYIKIIPEFQMNQISPIQLKKMIFSTKIWIIKNTIFNNMEKYIYPFG